MFLPRGDHWAAKRLPSCSCRNPGGGCSSAPLTHPSRSASHGPGTWRRGTSGAGGCRSFCEKLSHMILKNSRHLRNSQFQNHQDPQQLQETTIWTNFSVYSGSQGLNLFIKIVHNNEGRLRKAFQGRGRPCGSRWRPWLWSWHLWARILSQSVVWLWENYLTHQNLSL